MCDRVAPEARGSTNTAKWTLPGRSRPLARLWIVLAALLALCAAHDVASAREAESPERLLQPIPDVAKPNFVLPSLQNLPVDLSHQAGRVVLVHFFATWCEPCREELASLSAVVDRPGIMALSVLAVNVAEVPARIERFLAAAPVSFPVLLDGDRAVTRAWGVTVLPTTFVLDPALVPRLVVEGDLDWNRSDVRATLENVSAARKP